MKKLFFGLLALGLTGLPAQAADYLIDTKGAHAFIQFRIQHLGYSWLYGRFNDFEGTFSYDEKNPEKAGVTVTIDTASIDSNHAERDKHLRGKDFFDVNKYPQAKFVSTGYRETAEGKGELSGELTLHGTTRPITIDVTQVGAGDDPWGGYRRGFYGTTVIKPAEFGMDYDLGPASSTVELMLSVEGIRQ
ncbi:MAG: YceI family protein [Pseudomonadota bacterium]